MRKQLVVSLSDFRYVSIECPHCGTKLILDMKAKSAFARDHNVFTPQICPGCQARYDTKIKPGIDALQRVYQELFEIADQVSFIGESEPDERGEGVKGQ